MTHRKWQINETDELKCKELQKSAHIFPLTARLLLNRGIETKEDVDNFVNIENIPFNDPFLLKDMDKAVARIERAINNKERVCIYGDYDVDGVTSTVMLYLYLRMRGLEAEYFIPERISEGYGLSLPVIEKLKDKVDLIITVDTGVTAVSEAEYASSVGIDMVITDHHSCRETLPKAEAVVNPHRDDSEYPFRNLAGVGVVFKLLCALEGDTKKILDLYSDIIAVGTIADVMPIIGENRRIVGVGLQKLANTKNLGLIALMEKAGIIKHGRRVKKVTSVTVGYVLAPRINAAGRIVCASRAVELLLTEDPAEAEKIASELCEINKFRQATEQKIYEQATELINENYADDRFLVLSYDGWHQGVIGVVASKIAEKYSRPCILFSKDGDTAKGSGRSIKGFSLMDALSECGDLLLEYGGHELAAGLSIKCDNIEEFRRKINSYADPLLSKDENVFPIEIECETTLPEITEKGIDEMLTLEPFGLSNPQPVLLLKNVELRDIVPLSQGKHIRFRACGTGKFANMSVNAVWFGMPFEDLPYVEGDIVDIVYTADINEYMGMRTPQIFIKDVAVSESENSSILSMNEKFALLAEGKGYDGCEKDIPDLSDFRDVFRFVRREVGREGKKFSITASARTLRDDFEIDVSACKLKVILEVLNEQKLLSIDSRISDDLVCISLSTVAGKTNIDESPLLKKVRSAAEK